MEIRKKYSFYIEDKPSSNKLYFEKENDKMEEIKTKETMEPAEENGVPETEDITIFGKVDRFIVNSRKAKAEKKAAKAEAKKAREAEKEESSDGKKKINWKVVGLVSAAVAGGIGTALAVTSLHGDETYEPEEDSCGSKDATEAAKKTVEETKTEET